MKILALETATRRQSVAIVENTGVLGERVHENCTSHTRFLLPSIDELLGSLHLALSGLDGIVVSMGPGSFTGLRVGLSTAIGLRLATGLPLVGVPTMEALAWNLQGQTGRICPMIRSRPGEVYWAQFEWVGGTLTQLTPDQVGSLADCVESIPGPAWVLGDGWETNQSAFQDLLGPRAQVVEHRSRLSSAVSVARASQSRFLARDFLPVGVSPHYVQTSQAELTWMKKQAAGSEC